MSPDLAIEIWEALRPHISGGFQQAADDFAAVLIENGMNANEVAAVAQDSYVIKSLAEYANEELVYEDEDDDDYFDNMYDDDDNY
jgi:ABC-type Zn uptake system ZnuABC Zn-binding protein ZnuA